MIIKMLTFPFFACRKSAPKFLLDVYKQLSDEDDEGNGRYTRSADSEEGDNFITDIDKRAIDQSDIIMTFLNQSKAPIAAHNQCPSCIMNCIFRAPCVGGAT